MATTTDEKIAALREKIKHKEQELCILNHEVFALEWVKYYEEQKKLDKPTKM